MKAARCSRRVLRPAASSRSALMPCCPNAASDPLREAASSRPQHLTSIRAFGHGRHDAPPEVEHLRRQAGQPVERAERHVAALSAGSGPIGGTSSGGSKQMTLGRSSTSSAKRLRSAAARRRRRPGRRRWRSGRCRRRSPRRSPGPAPASARRRAGGCPPSARRGPPARRSGRPGSVPSRSSSEMWATSCQRSARARNSAVMASGAVTPE